MPNGGECAWPLLWSPSSIGRPTLHAVQSAVASRLGFQLRRLICRIAASGAGKGTLARSMMERGPATAPGQRPHVVWPETALHGPSSSTGTYVSSGRRATSAPVPLPSPRIQSCASRPALRHRCRPGRLPWAAGPAAGGPCMCMDPCRFHPPYPRPCLRKGGTASQVLVPLPHACVLPADPASFWLLAIHGDHPPMHASPFQFVQSSSGGRTGSCESVIDLDLLPLASDSLVYA